MRLLYFDAIFDAMAHVYRFPLLLLCLVTSLLGGAPTPTHAQGDAALSDSAYIAQHFRKEVYHIPMRDGKRLFTIAYIPKSPSKSKAKEQTYPIIMYRTPYRVAPYEADVLPASLRTPTPAMLRQGYIFVFQDVRGMFQSEGEFLNMRPHLPNKQGTADVDESTDTYDTIEWLLNKLKGKHNGRVGQWGISYPGFYSAAGLMCAHPALRAVSPQAPIADWWYDDFHHHGAFFLPHSFGFLSTFGLVRQGMTDWVEKDWDYGTPDGYDFYLNKMGPLANANTLFLKNRVAFWDSLCAHPNYDHFWQRRNILPHLKGLHPHTAVLTVGGWYDAEDLYGPLKIYQALEANNPANANMLVMGPWVHGGWLRSAGDQLGSVHFGSETSIFYQDSIIPVFFEHYLKDQGEMTLPEAFMFETGSNQWRRCATWPPTEVQHRPLYLHGDGSLYWVPPAEADTSHTAFVSDPNRPVPFQERISLRMDRAYMVDDQRFAARRPDVLVFQTDVLENDLTLAGPLLAKLIVSTSRADADWVVKLIDVYPDDHPKYPHNSASVAEGGMQQMVRSEVLRGRYRHSHAFPQPFVPNEADSVQLELQDVLHTFKKGHRLMIQIQSSWFPLVDRNPQNWVDNLYTLDDASIFAPATHRVYHAANKASHILLPVLAKPRSQD